jgi:hypothetical protein
MKPTCLGILFCLLISFEGCCIKPSRQQPTYPAGAKLGWNNGPSEKLTGSFVLKKGESTQFGDVQVTVEDIVDHNCSFDWEKSPIWVKLKFQSISNPSSGCEIGPVEGSSFRLGPSCAWLKKFDIQSVGVRAINTIENWAYFDVKD